MAELINEYEDWLKDERLSHTVPDMCRPLVSVTVLETLVVADEATTTELTDQVVNVFACATVDVQHKRKSEPIRLNGNYTPEKGQDFERQD